jgi:hypothetical protein
MSPSKTDVRIDALRSKPEKCGAQSSEGGFQTAEAIGIAAVGLLVLFGIWGAMSTLGVDVIEWIRTTFGIGGIPGS